MLLVFCAEIVEIKKGYSVIVQKTDIRCVRLIKVN